jgi:6-phospho-beta-glucosidase
MKIAIVGAGGMRLPLLYAALIDRSDGLGLNELSLMDIDADRLSLMLAVARARRGPEPASINVRPTVDLDQALEGATFVITTFRVGDMPGRVADERIPLAHGLLGQETTGAGGFAMAMRTVPVLRRVIDRMRRLCPDAWLVNFANPSGLLSEAARAAGWERSVGICDAPSTMQRLAAHLLDVPASEVYLDYFGLNHLGWVRRVLHRGEDFLPTFLSMIRAAGGFPGLSFEPDLLSALGMIPNEYLAYYYSSHQRLEEQRSSRQTRGEYLLELNAGLLDELSTLHAAGDSAGMLDRYQAYLTQRSESYVRRADEPDGQIPLLAGMEFGEAGGYADVALDLIASLLGRSLRVMILNVPNRGAVQGMAPDEVVEIPVLVTANALLPMAVGEIPGHCLGLMQQVKAFERLTIDAAVEGSLSKALTALTLHPLVADARKAQLVLDDFRRAHAATFPQLQ